MGQPAQRLVAVYDTEDHAREAAAALRSAGADAHEIRVGEPLDRVVSVEGEMREEMDRTIAGPGNVGPFTPQTRRGMTAGALIGAGIGLLLALPFAAIGFGDWNVAIRLAIVAIVGVLVGSTVGWVLGGGFGAERAEERLAAERGIPVSVPATRAFEDLLSRTRPLRLDLVAEDGTPIAPVASEPDEPIARRIGRNAAGEDRRE